MSESREELKERLCAAVKAYENYAAESKAQWEIARQAFAESQKLFRQLQIPDCAHNRAVAGGKRYAKYMFRAHPWFLSECQIEFLNEQVERKEYPALPYEMIYGELRPRWS